MNIRIATTEDLKALNISTRLLGDEALKRGYDITYCPASSTGETGVMICVKNGTRIAFKSTATELSPVYSYFAAEDKILTASLLKNRGISHPETWEVQDGSDVALDFNDRSYVVKPTAMNHGDGITTDIKDRGALTRAIKYAKQVSGRPSVLVQEQVNGTEYRFLVVDGVVVAVAGREPAFVIGDGKSTVKELITAKNLDPRRGEGHSSELSLISFDDVIHINGQAIMNKIPTKNQKVPLLHTSNLSKGGEAVDYTDEASDVLKRLAVGAADACSLGITGVDIMTDSISDPTNYAVIEVNHAPGLRMHHFPSTGKSRNVARIIFDELEQHSQQKMETIGVSSILDFVGYKNLKSIPARIDTGARTSSLWVSDLKIKNNIATFKLFGPGSKWYTGKLVRKKLQGTREVTSSTGHVQERYVVEMSIRLHGKRLNAKFTLSDRSTQTYPILIGRNTLRGNFLVDSGNPGEAMIYKYPEEESEFNESEAV